MHQVEKEIYLLGCKISNYTSKEIINQIHSLVLSKSKSSMMLSANIHSLNLAQKNPWLKEMMNNAELVRNDSMGLLLASRLQRKKLQERMTWADFGWDLAEFCSKNGISLFFLGDKPNVAEDAKKEILKKFPTVKILGTHHGYFAKSGEANELVIRKINQLKPEILIVGFGMPLQEKWILDNKEKINVKILMTGGNCFSYISGREKRAPLILRKIGFEWLFRFILEPKRLFKRYIIGNPLFFVRIIAENLKLIKY